MTNPHYAWLPPEINSALMFTGPGAEPLIAAGAAWNTLAEELAQSATSFGSVTSELAGRSWLGASSAAMMGVAAQYVGWLHTAATQAEAAAGKATAVAGAFEAAQAATVQPAVVAANRGLVQVLAATNWLGQNAAAIADIEAAYEQMWAMDVAAMTGYHADASLALAQLPSWDQVLHGLNIDTGRWNAGFGQTGWMNLSAQSLLTSAHVTGSLTAASLGWDMLGPASVVTGIHPPGSSG